MTTTPARLLIIDDDEAVTQTFAGILRLEGHEVRTAVDAESGLRQADALHPDAIIVDLRMPLINGLGFLYRLRSRERCKNENSQNSAHSFTSSRSGSKMSSTSHTRS
jgi:DNA-binding NtrC family response regulator